MLTISVLVLGLAALTVGFGGCGAADYVAEITVDNPTDYPLRVEVKSQGDTAWLPVGTAQRRAQQRFQQVLDQGEVWVFRFTYAGRLAGERTIPRSELEAAGWRVEIPAEVGSEILDQGIAPPP